MTQREPTIRTGKRIVELARCSLVVLSGPRRGDEMLMDKPVFLIGKSLDNDLVLDEQTVSRSHCEIIRDARGYLLRDLGSTNGTLLDGAEVREVYLKAGAVVTVGTVELKVRAFAERIEMLPSSATRFGSLRGVSQPMRELFGLLERIVNTEVAVFAHGEPGTGKDAIARSVHFQSARAEGPFIRVPCDELVASRADQDFFEPQGLLESAHRGTLYFENIGSLPKDIQPRLAHALENGSFKRGDDRVRFDLRVVSSSESDLDELVRRGYLIEELCSRVAAVPLHLPPLRERTEDIPVLVEALLERMGTHGGVAFAAAQEVLSALTENDWPGNVQGLHFVLRRAVRLAGENAETTLTLAHVPSSTQARGPAFDPAQSYRESKAAWDSVFEKSYVGWLLDRHGGNISAASRAADMDRKYLHKLSKKHGLHPSDRRKN